ncbi:uncharacterized protein LOC121390557 [Gigantopelta aegis]|uniref:uncharacterized protein LOC121390557 n=1 Tax=Gigantopelta aegis TaxID=1735272 RepID=UPI001B889096|nr:uncharacterized protein LOC121390557 [Gigantopelta aegis]XP_041378333.1 uncharacterized protein LOC121390557 [Gigantopelta aegis]XP_041378335.1 uncharacterized protein LOC121390557 [Gigantopelta aegis]
MTLLQTVIGVWTLIFLGVNFTEGGKYDGIYLNGPLVQVGKNKSIELKMVSEVMPNKTFRLVCSVLKYTMPFRFLGFEHSFVDSVPVRKEPGKRISKSVIEWTIHPYGYEDIGRYACYAKNAITRVDIVLSPLLNIPPQLADFENQYESIVLNVGDRLLLNKTILPTWKRMAYWKWVDPSGRIRKSEHLYHYVKFVVYGKEISLNAPEITMMIDAVTEADFGEYTLKVCDFVGCSIFTTSVLRKGAVAEPVRQDGDGDSGFMMILIMILVAGAMVSGGYILYKRKKRDQLAREASETHRASYQLEVENTE